MNPTIVINVRDNMNFLTKPGVVFIGRPSKWGNPFYIGADGTREQVIEKYRKWLMAQHDLLADLHELKGKRLACYCAPLPCHGDVLAELADVGGPR